MGIFGPKPHLTLHSKLKGQSENIIHQPKSVSDNDFIKNAKIDIVAVSPYRIEWYYIIDEKTGNFVYDFSKN